MITLEQLDNILEYIPDTGELKYKISRGCKAKGSTAGYIHRTGYIQVELSGKAYLAHRLAWLLYYKVWPTNNIDHINRVKSDNRITNLRDATQEQNMANRSINKNNTSGYPGVSYYKSTGKWVSKYGGKHLGYFNTPEEGHMAYTKYKESVE